MASFSPISFSSVSFDVGQEQVSSTTGGKKNRWRAWVQGLARGLRDFFKIKQREPGPPLVEIPPAQYPAGKKVTILAEPPTEQNPLPTSVFASTPPVESAILHNESPVLDNVTNDTIYPVIKNPLTSPLIQTKVTLPRATRSTSLPPYRVAEGSHIESQFLEMKKPKKSRAAAINTLMLLLEIERQV